MAKVLLVDDEPDLLEILSLVLDSTGHETLEAKNGKDGLVKLKENDDIEIIISDLTMPEMNGLVFLEELRKSGFHQPFIFLTGNGDKKTSQQALRLGAFDFIDKPFKTEHINSLIESALRIAKDPELANINFEDDESSADQKPVSEDSSFELEGTPFSGLDIDAEKLAAFFEHTSNQFEFAKAAVQGLTDPENSALEVGYLLRLMRDTYSKSKGHKLKDVAQLCKGYTEVLIYYRTNLDEIDESAVTLIKNGVENIGQLLKNYQDPSTPSGQFIACLVKVSDHCRMLHKDDDADAAA